MTKLLASLLALAPALALAAPTTWNVDASHSQVGFAVKHLVISNVRGEFGDLPGQDLPSTTRTSRGPPSRPPST